MIRVLLADDQQIVRAGLRMLCETAPDIAVVAEATNGLDAARLAQRERPDVVLMDLRMPVLDGIGAAERILRSRPATRIVVLTTFDDDDHLYPALAAGACGFLAKDLAPADLLDAVRRAAEGESPFSSGVLRRIVAAALERRSTDTAYPLPELTVRQREVLTLVVDGAANAEIAASLHIGVTTVKTHVASLMAKTGTTSRISLAVLAARHGIGAS
ncbi:DNA-binding response regulator [Actinocatenispora thailandica]|uniref:DNA-binding response regulator n=1 Tax=Actinocatenispora thailandica TaxID=227318 RepID=A0A7R7DLV0_9ACTN|nr:response regulator transcription factor [Actinocatenispora thailandica]BCJ33987.1 DNA-binding response regulator [Actinocatenispora thailandica]